MADEDEAAILQQIRALEAKLKSKRTEDNRTSEQKDGQASSRRIIIVANRLPMSLNQNQETGEWETKLSSGGLVSALMGVKDMEMIWIGWPGTEIPEEEQDKVQESARKEGCRAVFVPKAVSEGHYNGFSNGILWPLFHYIQLTIEETVNTMENCWNKYVEANKIFARAVLEEYKDGDMVWVHDYHLMLMPALLRSKVPSMKIGWFLHTPFPSSELYRTLPVRNELLSGVLAADLLGFHTYDYARHFKSACTRVLGLEVTHQGVEMQGHFCTVGTFPIGIDAEKFLDALDDERTRKHFAELQRRFGGKKVFLGIDRLDYVKGFPHKLLALEKFLDENPEWQGKVVLVQIAVPSRQKVPMYKRLREQVHQLVGRINGKFGTIDTVPIHYLDQSIDFYKMVALYRVSDLCIVSSLRDGMNLVSFEFVACQHEKPSPGSLILSDFAGAAQSLGAGAIRVNPWDVDGMALAIKEALDLSPEERHECQSYAFNYVSKYSAQHWANTFTHTLRALPISSAASSIPMKLRKRDVGKAFLHAKNRLVIIGMVGTITKQRYNSMSYDMFARLAQVPDEILASISRLANDPNTTVVVMTSRSRDMIDRMVGETGAWLLPENGYFFRKGKHAKWTTLNDNMDLSWFGQVEDVVNYFAQRTPRSVLEREETYLSWYYRDSDPEWAKLQANDLLTHLTNNPMSSHGFEIVRGPQLVQIRPAGTSKDAAAEHCIELLEEERGQPVDFVLCAGNFLLKDEDVFVNMKQHATAPRDDKGFTSFFDQDTRSSESGENSPPLLSINRNMSPVTSTDDISPHRSVFTVTVGQKRASRADYYVRDSEEVGELLNMLEKCLPLEEGVKL